ncbi:MAG: 3',5'-cyclic adenosine monophosphate phosphodiesterase CpdA [Catillopecten margaritatus gill symbiont]|uniref:3',5'-cyclic adenosine monophosphate phosphodiesterase CpdA n=1 Tax=Catillopecten margaritatus gill symbiont TaxID=3083288 RepID=A0AAU6PEI3_9GAMM
MNQFIQISDCHIDDIEQCMGVNSQQNLTRVIDEIALLESDALLISGDLTHNGTLTSYKILKQLLSPVQSDIFVIGGNHDSDNITAIFDDCLFKKISLGTWDIISVNSVQANKTSGFLPKNTLIKLDTQLNNSSAKHILIVLHHPIVPMKSTWDDTLSLENPEDLFTILAKHDKIQAVLFGHAHESAEFEKDGLKIIACPSTAVQFTDEKRIGFNYYTLNDDGHLHYETRWITS